MEALDPAVSPCMLQEKHTVGRSTRRSPGHYEKLLFFKLMNSFNESSHAGQVHSVNSCMTTMFLAMSTPWPREQNEQCALMLPRCVGSSFLGRDIYSRHRMMKPQTTRSKEILFSFVEYKEPKKKR